MIHSKNVIDNILLIYADDLEKQEWKKKVRNFFNELKLIYPFKE